MNRSYFTLSLVFLLLLTTETSIVYAPGNLVPTVTPFTVHDGRRSPHYTEFTFDIEPKYTMIEPLPLDWEVSLRVDVLENDRVKQIEFYVFVEEPREDEGIQVNSNDLKDGIVEILDSTGTPVGVQMEKWKDDEWEGMNHGWWYRGDVVSEVPFVKGDFFYIEFTIPYPQFDYQPLSPDLDTNYPDTFDLFLAHHIARGDMPGENTYSHFLKFRVGLKYDDIPPQFMIPELPLGTLTALTALMIALILYARGRNDGRASYLISE